MASVVFGFKKSQGSKWPSRFRGAKDGTMLFMRSILMTEDQTYYTAKKYGARTSQKWRSKQVHTSCKGVGSHDHSTIEDYAKMKVRPCKICRKHTGGPKKKPWKMERHKPQVKVKTYMELSNTRQVHTSCIWGCGTLRWHTEIGGAS